MMWANCASFYPIYGGDALLLNQLYILVINTKEYPFLLEKQKNNTLNEEIKRYREEAVHYKAENNTLRGQIKSLQEQSGQSEELQAKDETISQLQNTIEEIKNNFGASDNDEIMEEFQNYKEETDRAVSRVHKMGIFIHIFACI